MELKTLFSPSKIGNVKIKNRIVRSATYTHSATDDGHATDLLTKYHTDLAEGGTGLIITGIVSIDEEGKINEGQACLSNDSHIKSHREMVDAVHEFSDVKIAPQLSHAGRQGRNPVAPSPVLFRPRNVVPREIKIEEIKEVVKNFINAGKRAYECGYDLLQLNAGHGWLLSNFLSPYTNKRTDEYGGILLNRIRILIEIYEGILDEVGKDFPIFAKLQIQDFLEEGLIIEEGKKIAKILIDTGFAALEPTGGGGHTTLNRTKIYPSFVVKSEEEENYFLPALKELKPVTKNCKLILMGGVRNPITAEKLLNDGTVDFVAFSRPLICEPDLPNRWKKGDYASALCNSCNQCYKSTRTGSLKCIIKDQLLSKV